MNFIIYSLFIQIYLQTVIILSHSLSPVIDNSTLRLAVVRLSTLIYLSAWQARLALLGIHFNELRVN